MWEINNNLQAVNFLYSMILGTAFALFYDIFRSLRLAKQHSTLAVFIEDIIYFLVLSVITFLSFLTFTNGEIRGYILVGIIFGFLIFILTISKYNIILLTYILKIIFKLFRLVSKFFYIIIEKIDYLIMIFLKNTLKCLKKCLKKLIDMLYTNS